MIKNNLLIIYLIGFCIEIVRSLQFMHNYEQLKTKSNQTIPAMSLRFKRYVLIKPVLWPYYFFVEKSPIERLSELLFKHYGEEGVTYLGSRGLKNFLNDVVKGKNRYDNYHVDSLICNLDKNSASFKTYSSLPSHLRDNLVALVTFIKHANRYLLRIELADREFFESNQKISRYELDQCKWLNETQFEQQLEILHHLDQKKIKEHLNINS